MKIRLDIPDDGRKFRAFLGRELIAFIEDGYLYTKIESCNYCGECCMNNPGVDDDEEGKCRSLVKVGDIWECTRGVDVPWRCLDDPTFDESHLLTEGGDAILTEDGEVSYCSIRYKKTKVR